MSLGPFNLLVTLSKFCTRFVNVPETDWKIFPNTNSKSATYFKSPRTAKIQNVSFKYIFFT